ncbi:MAG: glycoside hydrolase family 3 N-terminal domain-containing protein [Actinomycetota bacterium]|nr:glycoside hydrolase family 3 N-terminal domain-containing protein [Actinomycetota bacterium]
MTSTTREPAYLDPGLEPTARAADLLGRMTLEEKVGQLGSAWVFQLADAGRFDPARAEPLLADGLGQVTRISGASHLGGVAAAELANRIQRHLVEHTRLGVPAIVHEEICSGPMAREATIFAQAIGVASTWDPELNERLATEVRRQMRAMGAHQGLSPVLDVCRDPRWGRTEETYGEDPHLVARMGVAFVRGLQGDDPATGVIATPKHFVGYGASEGGLNWAPAHLGPRELREVYLHPFEAVVREAGARSIMNAYNELDGIPCGASAELLTTILRDEWGFDGFAVSDYFSIRQLAEYHRVVEDPTGAAVVAMAAGMDVELPGTDCFGATLVHAVRDGRVPTTDLDRAVLGVLRAKVELGLFEQPYVDTGAVAPVSRTPDQLELARTIAARSLVLLRNDGVLPLAPGLDNVAVIGPSADSARNLLGDYSYAAHAESLTEVLDSGQNVFELPVDGSSSFTDGAVPARIRTVLGALTDRLGAGVVHHVVGCGLGDDDRSGFDEAVRAAAAADVAVCVVGDRCGLTDECTSGESRDVARLRLPGVQEKLVHAVAATGTPVVLVLVAGRPYGPEALHDAAAAVLMAWLPGEVGGEAIAAALVGETSPGGKLPMTWPRDPGQLPTYHGHKVSGGRSHWKGDYVDVPVAPLHPFGHGLSYTTFALDVADIDEGPHDPDAVVNVSVGVTNTGEVTGDEVVQLYTRDPVASVTRPVRELRGFRRVSLAPGEHRTIRFGVPVAQLGFCGPDLRHVVEPGVVEVHVGTSAADARQVGRIIVAGDAPVEVTKVFDSTCDPA